MFIDYEYIKVGMAAIIGLCLGSFYNVCIHRYVTGMSIAFPPSHCPKCDKRLGLLELIPVVSWVVLRGRCLGCRQEISWRYPVVEMISALWAIAIAVKFESLVFFIAYLLFGGMLIVLSFIDIDMYLLPDVITIPGTFVSIATATLLLNASYQDSLGGALLGGGGLMAIIYAYKKLRGIDGMGLGDAKLLMMIGGMLGIQSLPIVVMSGSIFALVFSYFFALKYSRVDCIGTLKIPFGPFLSLGAAMSILFGDAIWNWYLINFF